MQPKLGRGKVADGTGETEGGMEPGGGAEDLEAGLVVGEEVGSVHQLMLEGGPEGFHGGVIVAVALAAHGRHEPGLRERVAAGAVARVQDACNAAADAGVPLGALAGATQWDRSCSLDLLPQIPRSSVVTGMVLARASLTPRLAEASASQSLPSQWHRPGPGSFRTSWAASNPSGLFLPTCLPDDWRHRTRHAAHCASPRLM